MPQKAAVVFTYKSVERILQTGGTQSWRMDPKHFGTFEFVVCTRNQRHPNVEGHEEHASAFLLGRVDKIVPSTDPRIVAETAKTGRKRYLILMREAAVISVPKVWRYGRWPVAFVDLAAIGLDPSKYTFKPLPDLLAEVQRSRGLSDPVLPGGVLPPIAASDWRKHVDEARAVLSSRLGVAPSAIRITVDL